MTKVKSTVTPDQVKAALRVIRLVADAIRDLGSVPSGHLYATLMSHLSLESYQHVIGTLKHAGLVEERFHELFWIGPK